MSLKNKSYPLLSIIMPAYNEEKTISKVINDILSLNILNGSFEIIVIESNSSDSTRQILRNNYSNNERIHIYYQDKPLGKGYAVREGFLYAKGNIILIQDADDEYDVNDYTKLLQPLLNSDAVFVLGSRHSPNKRMRVFDDQPLRAAILNVGHIFFTYSINFLFKVKLYDPFTMFKVFKKSCIKDMNFRCNRFDFDHELVIKMILAGFTPTEIPVSYISRSFNDGKKIRFIYDPISWLLIILKLWFKHKILKIK